MPETALQPRKAVRRGVKSRIAMTGPDGSGKTKSALVLAGALAPGGKVCSIDTEHDSACLYVDEIGYEYDIVNFEAPFNPARLTALLRQLGSQYDVLIVDSLSHFWAGKGGVRDIVDEESARVKGNSYVAWRKGTPLQDTMIETLLALPCHVICTMRSKLDYAQNTDSQGRKTIEKLGMAPIQRDGVGYEFTMVLDCDRRHNIIVDKSRMTAIADRVIHPGVDNVHALGVEIREWLAGAVAADLTMPMPTEPDQTERAVKVVDFDQIQRDIAKERGVKLPAEVQIVPESVAASPAPLPHVSGGIDRVTMANEIIDRVTKSFPNAAARKAAIEPFGYDPKSGDMAAVFIRGASDEKLAEMAIAFGVQA